MGDVGEPDAEQERPSRFARVLRVLGLARASPDAPPLPLVSKVLLALGALSVYNIFTNYQTLVDLSESIHWLARWWRYLIGIPFDWLHIDLNQLQREAVVLLLFFTGAANVAIYRWKRVAPYKHFAEMIREIFLHRQAHFAPRHPFAWAVKYPWYVSRLLEMMVTMAPLAVILPGMNITRLATITVIAYMVIANSLDALKIDFREEGREFPEWLSSLTNILMLPIFVYALWIHTLSAFYREILRSLAALLLVLALDITLKYSLDLLLQAFPTLPEPPSHDSAQR